MRWIEMIDVVRQRYTDPATARPGSAMLQCSVP
jgi:hypothetical protein